MVDVDQFFFQNVKFIKSALCSSLFHIYAELDLDLVSSEKLWNKGMECNIPVVGTHCLLGGVPRVILHYKYLD